MAVDYSSWLEAAKGELLRLQGEKNRIRNERAALDFSERDVDKRIDAMAQTVSALASLVPEAAPEPTLMGILSAIGKTLVDVGIKGRILAILQANAPKQFSAVEIRAELEAGGFYLGDYSNALSTIYTTLKRMVDTGEISEKQVAEGKKFHAQSLLTPGPLPAMLATLDMPRLPPPQYGRRQRKQEKK
ncbi:MAG TPA: hypothetical protein VK335_00795 [Bryobacteraceae bacterium]|nr:hypothetical protein [Bryobacteraceae bacterium]HZW92040.1 hypothetical protein [Candidatus Eremiobacteraceae bacterium]